MSVMRKHRLAELLLTDVIGLEWEHVHVEACRWEHVISDAVEKRLIELLDNPTTCPHGNPIPGLSGQITQPSLIPLSAAAAQGSRGRIERISEKLQVDVEQMRFLREHGLRPGVTAAFSLGAEGVTAAVDGAQVPIPGTTAEQIYVIPAA